MSFLDIICKSSTTRRDVDSQLLKADSTRHKLNMGLVWQRALQMFERKKINFAPKRKDVFPKNAFCFIIIIITPCVPRVP